MEIRVKAHDGITLGMVKDEVLKALLGGKGIEDCRHPAQKKRKMLCDEELVKDWGKDDFDICFIKTVTDA